MSVTHNRRILLIMPEQLVELTDEVARVLNTTRLAIIRNAIVGHVIRFHRDRRLGLGERSASNNSLNLGRERAPDDFWVED